MEPGLRGGCENSLGDDYATYADANAAQRREARLLSNLLVPYTPLANHGCSAAAFALATRARSWRVGTTPTLHFLRPPA